MPPKTLWFLLVSPTLLGCDFWTKGAVNASIPLHETVPVVPGWIALTHAENPFAAFSMPFPYVVTALFGIVATIALVLHLRQLPAGASLRAAALGALLAGALGNLLDRLPDGTVTDFVMLYTVHPTLQPWLVERFGTSVWPIFNVADVALIGGLLLYLVATALQPDEEPPIEAS